MMNTDNEYIDDVTEFVDSNDNGDSDDDDSRVVDDNNDDDRG